MIVTGWNNGSPNNTTGGGYGIRISRQDRDTYFHQEWQSVVIELEDCDATEVNLTASFWRGCTELRGRKIGRFLLDHELAPWPKRKPPRLRLEPLRSRRFKLTSEMGGSVRVPSSRARSSSAEAAMDFEQHLTQIQEHFRAKLQTVQ